MRIFGIAVGEIIYSQAKYVDNPNLRLPWLADAALQYLLYYGLRQPNLFSLSQEDELMQKEVTAQVQAIRKSVDNGATAIDFDMYYPPSFSLAGTKSANAEHESPTETRLRIFRCHVAAETLLLFLQALPHPLLPASAPSLENIVAACENVSTVGPARTVYLIRNELKNLLSPNLFLLRALLIFSRCITLNNSHNGCTLDTVSQQIAPLIIWTNNRTPVPSASKVLQVLITLQDDIFSAFDVCGDVFVEDIGGSHVNLLSVVIKCHSPPLSPSTAGMSPRTTHLARPLAGGYAMTSLLATPHNVWAFHPNGHTRAFCFDPSGYELVRHVDMKHPHLHCMVCTGPHVWVGSAGGFALYNSQNAAFLKTVSTEPALCHVVAMAALPNGHVWVAGTAELRSPSVTAVLAFEAITSDAVSTVAIEMPYAGMDIRCMAHVAIGNCVVGYDATRRQMIVWNADTNSAQYGRVVSTVDIRMNILRLCVIDNRWVWVASADGRLAVFDPVELRLVGQPVTAAAGHGGAVALAYFSEKHEVWTAHGTIVRVWEARPPEMSTMATATWPRTVSEVRPVHSAPVSDILFVPNTKKGDIEVWMVSNDEISVNTAARGGAPGRRRVASTLETSGDGVPAVAKTTSVNEAAERTFEISPNEIRILREISRGFGSVVYEGELRGHRVAVKKITNRSLEQTLTSADMREFRRTVSTLCTLNCPQIVLYMGACTRPGDLFIVMELMARGSVQDLLRNSQENISLPQRLRWARDTARAMEYLHLSRPVFVHKNLRTKNLLVNDKGKMKLSTGLVEYDAGANSNTSAGLSISGNSAPLPYWWAPEVHKGGEFTPSADVWGFGLVLWELYTRSDPYLATMRTRSQVVREIDTKCASTEDGSTVVEIPAECPSKLANLIRRCLCIDPAKRPTFAEMVNSRVFESLIIDEVIRDEAGRNLWKERFIDDDEVKVEELLAAIQDYVDTCPATLKPTQPVAVSRELQRAHLKAILLEDDNSTTVTMQHFANILLWVGPLDGDIMNRVSALVRLDWFHGSLPMADTVALLSQENNKKGSFILRFSSEPGFYSFSVVQQSRTVKHFRVAYCPVGSSGKPAYKISNAEVSKPEDIVKLYGKSLGMDPKRPAKGWSKWRQRLDMLMREVTASRLKEDLLASQRARSAYVDIHLKQP